MKTLDIRKRACSFRELRCNLLHMYGLIYIIIVRSSIKYTHNTHCAYPAGKTGLLCQLGQYRLFNWLCYLFRTYINDAQSITYRILLRKGATKYVSVANHGFVAGRDVLSARGRCSHKQLKNCNYSTIQNDDRRNKTDKPHICRQDTSQVVASKGPG